MMTLIVLQPRPKKGSTAAVTQVYHPDELGLKALQANEDCIKRCGRHVILIKDADKIV